MNNIKQKTVSGLVWNFVERFGMRTVSLLFGIILARLLTPSDFGVATMPMVFLTIASCFIDCGFANALIRKEKITEEDLNTFFIFGLGVGVVCYVILFFMSPLIADFYHTPELEKIVKVVALSTLIGPISSVQGVLMVRELNFKSLAKLSLISSIVSGVLGIMLALNGLGVWALVVQNISSQIIRSLLMWTNKPWCPRIMWCSRSFGYLWGYGSKLMITSLLYVAYENIYPVIIGRCYQPIQLGNYQKANSLASMPTQMASDVIKKVTFPVLCKFQENTSLLATNYRKMLRLIVFAFFPLMIGMAVLSQSIVSILLGDQWNGVVVIVQLLCLGMMLYPVHSLNLNLLQAQGRSDLFLKLEVIKGILGAAVLLVAVPHGILWIAASVPVLSVLALFINSYYTKGLAGITIIQQFSDISCSFMTSVAIGLILMLMNKCFDNDIIKVMFDITVGLLSYVLIAGRCMREEMNEVLRIIKTYIH